MSKQQNEDTNQDQREWEANALKLHIDVEPGWKRGDPIGYIRPDIPDFEVPVYEGQRYEALVPDTLDLQDRAALAVNGLTGPTDPLADYDLYFFAWFLGNPPMMQHDQDSVCLSKLMESLPLMRIISGSDLNKQVDRRWMEVALHQQGPDGLMYWPAKGRPWAILGMEDQLPARARTTEQHIMPLYCGRLLSTLMLYYLRDGGTLWKESAERLVDGLVDLAVDRGDYAFFAPHHSWAEKGATEDLTSNTHQALEARVVILGLVHVYRQTGYEPARQLAKKLINYMLDVTQGFDQDGRFAGSVSDPVLRPAAHFHTHTSALQAVLEYATATGETSYFELVHKGYEYGKANGNVLLGYFPEFVNSPRLEHSELCEVADMIALALKLTDAGVGDYWDDADRWIRNMFVEGQLTRTDWINHLHTAGMEETREVDVLPSQINPLYQTTDRVAERNLGAFAGWPKANDWYTGQGIGIMHCCTGNATRALYYAWDHILRHEDGKLRVNLLLNRASLWADVDSHIPYTGQVDVKVKQPVDLSIRIPEWVSAEDTRCQVAGVEHVLGFDGRYAQVGAVKPGDVVTLTFPIAERTDIVYVEKEKYTLTRKGNDVVHIDPPGKYCPLYQRDHYRTNTTRWRKVERFASNEIIHW